jgi:hypothetical protein
MLRFVTAQRINRRKDALIKKAHVLNLGACKGEHTLKLRAD